MHNLQPIERRLDIKTDAHEKIRKILRDHIGYVLVTCRPTTQPGRMEVEVSYEGDPDLASYLVDGAQGYFELEHEENL